MSQYAVSDFLFSLCFWVHFLSVFFCCSVQLCSPTSVHFSLIPPPLPKAAYKCKMSYRFAFFPPLPKFSLASTNPPLTKRTHIVMNIYAFSCRLSCCYCKNVTSRTNTRTALSYLYAPFPFLNPAHTCILKKKYRVKQENRHTNKTKEKGPTSPPTIHDLSLSLLRFPPLPPLYAADEN